MWKIYTYINRQKLVHANKHIGIEFMPKYLNIKKIIKHTKFDTRLQFLNDDNVSIKILCSMVHFTTEDHFTDNTNNYSLKHNSRICNIILVRVLSASLFYEAFLDPCLHMWVCKFSIYNGIGNDHQQTS